MLSEKLLQYLSEKDIEDYFFNRPQVLDNTLEWIGRQVRLPSGIADLVGFHYTNTNGRPRLYVLELKKEAIKSQHLTQVCRYTEDLDRIIDEIYFHEHDQMVTRDDRVRAEKVVAGFGVAGDHVMFEADAMGVTLVNLTMDVYISPAYIGFDWQRNEKIEEAYKKISLQGAFSEFVKDARELARKTFADAPDHIKASLPAFRENNKE